MKTFWKSMLEFLIDSMGSFVFYVAFILASSLSDGIKYPSLLGFHLRVCLWWLEPQYLYVSFFFIFNMGLPNIYIWYFFSTVWKYSISFGSIEIDTNRNQKKFVQFCSKPSTISTSFVQYHFCYFLFLGKKLPSVTFPFVLLVLVNY